MGVRNVLTLGLAAALGAAALVGGAQPAGAYTAGPVCGQKVVQSPSGVAFLILFANNGAVQRYQVTAKAENPEAVNDARISLENTYGPAGVDAPPLKIISFKPSDNGGGMQVPDKAIDSCGRTLDFN